mgnify:CR=1 FL=1
MNTIRTLFASLLVASVTLGAQAQTAPAGSTPTADHMKSQDCARPMPKHDHGAEKGTPRPVAKFGPCETGAAVSAPEGAASTAQAKKLPRHNHSAEKNN